MGRRSQEDSIAELDTGAAKLQEVPKLHDCYVSTPNPLWLDLTLYTFIYGLDGQALQEGLLLLFGFATLVTENIFAGTVKQGVVILNRPSYPINGQMGPLLLTGLPA